MILTDILASPKSRFKAKDFKLKAVSVMKTIKCIMECGILPVLVGFCIKRVEAGVRKVFFYYCKLLK